MSLKKLNDDILKIRKPRPSYPVIEEIKNRFSPRHFSSEPIPEKDLNPIFEAARFAPSGWNFEPWYFYWAKKGEKSFGKIVSCLSEDNRYAEKAPVLIVACFIEKVKGEKAYYRHDLGAAVMSLVLQAQHLGYYTRQMGEFNEEELINLLNIDKSHKPFVIIALGKIGDYRKIDDVLLKRELDPRPRKEDFVRKI